jgi:phosphoglycerate kinase
MKSIREADFSPQMKVLVRADLDVPLSNSTIEDTFRLDHVLPTLEFIVESGGFPIIMGHLGRPGGEYKEELSSKHLAPYFDKHLGEGKYELLENLRFDPRERQNDQDFAKELASKADIYVNEAFSNSHREHASMVGVPLLLPSYMGLHLKKEIEALEGVLNAPKHPFAVIIGGAKMETKRPVVDKFLEIADAVLVGGKIGLDWQGTKPENLYLPVDYVDDKDIGEKTVEGYSEIIQNAKTIVWSGPLGMFEDERYEGGTRSILDAVLSSSANTIVGGGDTIAALNQFGKLKEISFVSTGGGAMLEFLVKGTLPALKALN